MTENFGLELDDGDWELPAHWRARCREGHPGVIVTGLRRWIYELTCEARQALLMGSMWRGGAGL